MQSLFALGFLPFKLYICQMRLISYLVLTIICLSVFTRASGSIEPGNFLPAEKIETTICLSDQGQFISPVSTLRLVHFLQRGGKVSSKQPGQGTAGILFLSPSGSLPTEAETLSPDHHCLPIGIKLIFPEHYFF